MHFGSVGYVESLVKTASINSMSWLIAAVIGPFVAGILIGLSRDLVIILV
ncbi:MAG: hypothetical protein IPN72_25140 [Saprospiraceae bacterium]|nr:hypothetical protein [Saprospiraceae bacterium]